MKIPKHYYFELAVFCMHYHSGQSSKGYRILSKLELKNLSSNAEKEASESEIYQYLVSKYGNKV